jgi:hypothetical protein
MSTVNRSTPRRGTGATVLTRATYAVDSREHVVG